MCGIFGFLCGDQAVCGRSIGLLGCMGGADSRALIVIKILHKVELALHLDQLLLGSLCLVKFALLGQILHFIFLCIDLVKQFKQFFRHIVLLSCRFRTCCTVAVM